jgi:hypothetical protein
MKKRPLGQEFADIEKWQVVDPKEPSASRLASLLNEHAESVPGRRILRLLELCRQYSADAKKAPRLVPKGRREYVHLDKVSPAYSKICACVRRYRFRLEILSGFWRPRSGPGFRYVSDLRRLKVKRLEDVQASAAEGDMARRVLLAMQDDQLDALRRCQLQGCGKWFFSTKRVKQYHSPKCARDAYENSASGREKNRKRQKRFYDSKLKSTGRRKHTRAR